MTAVYGPQEEFDKKMFIRELCRIKHGVKPEWLLLEDFNLIYKVQDKNNDRINSRLMMRFRRALSYMEVKEIELIGRKFTWSNNQSNPTLSRIDRAFCSTAREEMFINPVLQPLLASSSNHCPLLLQPLCPLLSSHVLGLNLGGSASLGSRNVSMRHGARR
jgi:hypothetical protein